MYVFRSSELPYLVFVIEGDGYFFLPHPWTFLKIVLMYLLAGVGVVSVVAADDRIVLSGTEDDGPYISQPVEKNFVKLGKLTVNTESWICIVMRLKLFLEKWLKTNFKVIRLLRFYK